MSEKNTPSDESVAHAEEVEIDRREALKRLGKYGAYTAPVVLSLLTPRRSQAGTASIWMM